jgi:hypothetical protein
LNSPGLRPDQMHNPATYVVAGDLREGGLVQRYAGELEQWRRREKASPTWHAALSPTALVIAAVHSLFSGMRSGRDGAGMQVHVLEWQRITGRSERQVQKAFAQLKRSGWLIRRARFVECPEWVDANGARHIHAQVRSASYLTDFARRRLASAFGTRALFIRSGRSERRLTVCGLLKDLLKTLAQKLRFLSRRISTVCVSAPLPLERRQDQKKNHSEGGAGVVDNWRNTGPPGGMSPLRGQDNRPKPPDQAQRGNPLATAFGSLGRRGSKAAADWNAELERLWHRRAMTARDAWPEVWRQGDARQREWLTQEFSKYGRALARRIRGDA